MCLPPLWVYYESRLMQITILGAGAWGTALAITLSRHHQITLWARSHTKVADMLHAHENKAYLPGFTLPDNLHITADLSDAIASLSETAAPALLIVASSVSGLRPIAEQLRAYTLPNIVWLCKGLEENTQLLPHQVIRQVLGERIPAGALSGPSFAQEAARGLPFGLTIASKNATLCDTVVSAMHADNLRIYSSDDVVGVEIGGAVKNIMAIATGISDGLQLGFNARAALITRGLAEMSRLGTALGGKSETFMGLSGVGDLLLTCTGDLSRNRQVGLALARGEKLDDIIIRLGHVAEGVRCAKAVKQLADAHGVEMPITRAVTEALFHQRAIDTIVMQLLARQPKEETE